MMAKISGQIIEDAKTKFLTVNSIFLVKINY